MEKKKLVNYLCEVCIIWLKRIIKHHSLPSSTKLNRLIHEDYEKAYFKISKAVSICLQKELEYTYRFNNQANILELMYKFIMLVSDMQEINPNFCIDFKFGANIKVADEDPKDKRLFILNIKKIVMDAYLNEEVEIDSHTRKERFMEILEVYYSSSSIRNQAENHPLTYSLVASTFPKLANWAKKRPEDKNWLISFLEKWIIKDLTDVNAVIEERATGQLDSTTLPKILPHLSVRIYHELSREHIDIIDHMLVVKIIWIYRKLFLFLETYFKKTPTQNGIPSVINTEFNQESNESSKSLIFFPRDSEFKQQINDNTYSQITIIKSMQIAAVKMHEFDINLLDEYLKLLDSIIAYCKNEELSMMIYEIYECLLVSPKPNPLGVKIDLSFAKKVWLGSCLLKKAVNETSKKLKDRMEATITDFLTTHKLNNTDETMNLYDYAVFFFTNSENKKKIQKVFEISFGAGLFNKLRFILDNKVNQEFIHMNSPPIIMRKIAEAIMSHFDDIIGTSCQQKNACVLRDLCNEVNCDQEMAPADEEQTEIEKLLIDHKKYIEDADIFKSKFYCQNVKKLFPQVWKTFTKEQKQYLAFCLKTFFMNYIKFLHGQKKKISAEFESFPNDLLEILQQLEPQVVLGVEFHTKATMKNNCWVNCILTLEEQVKALPEHSKSQYLILNDLYASLDQRDYCVNKGNTETIKRAITYSQFGMWEEVNAELNNTLKRMTDFSNDIEDDLIYSNEYDQQLWENLHPEGIVNTGDLDRLKFFNQNNGRNYGAFKAEFQKWMVLGKTNATYQVFEGNREKLCQEYTLLPKFIDQVHYQKLARFQENVELNEIMALLHNCRGTAKDKALKDFYTASALQRDRIPVKCEPVKIWKDILENRYIPLNILNANMIHNKQKAAMQDPQQAVASNKFVFKRLLNYVWDKLLIAKQSRRNNCLEQCKRYLTDAEALITSSDNEKLNGIALQKEKYVLIQEKLKLILHHFRFNVRLDLKKEHFDAIRGQMIDKGLEMSSPEILAKLQSLEEDVLSRTSTDPALTANENKEKVYREIWESEIYRLRGKLYLENKDYDQANECFMKAIELCDTSKKNWESLAEASKMFIKLYTGEPVIRPRTPSAKAARDSHMPSQGDESSILDWVCTAVYAYNKTIKHHLFHSRIYIIELLNLISKYSKYSTRGEIKNTFEKGFHDSQVWVWIFWIPQLLNLMMRGGIEGEIVKMIMADIAIFYPQPLYLELRKFYWYIGGNKGKKSEPKYSFMTDKQQSNINSLGKYLHETLSERFKGSVETIETIVREFKKVFDGRKEELYTIIEKGYELSFKPDFKSDLYCVKIKKGFFDPIKEGEKGFLATTLKKQFDKDFIDLDDSENKELKIQENLKKWKDMLYRRLKLKMAKSSLFEISKKLATFNYKSGIELPGQYLEIDVEPFEERRILMTKFEPNLFIPEVNKKCIIIRTNTGKRLIYSIFLNVRLYENSTKTDERITHFKVFLNKLLNYKNIESMRRGVKLGVFKKILFPFTKLYEENNLASLDEIYKSACSEAGVDSDCASSIYVNEMKRIMNAKRPEERQIIDDDDKEMVTKKCNKFMRKIIDKKYLSNYFKGIMKTMDDYFIYRKQFTQYYAANCFLTYILNLTENTPSNLRICLKYGRVFHNECKIYYHPSGMIRDSEEGVPFRLSDNIREFITDIGLEGLFPNTMASCSLAFEERYIRSYLHLFFEEEYMQMSKIDEEKTTELVGDVIDRVEEIARPYIDVQNSSQLRRLYLSPDEQKEEEELEQFAKETLNSKRFNWKAHELIKRATDMESLLTADLSNKSTFM